MIRLLSILVVCIAAICGDAFSVGRCCADEPKKNEPLPKVQATKDYNEAILEHFKQPTDTASLIAYLKDHSASDDDLLAIPQLIKQLGNDKFREREAASKKLISLGLPTIQPLREALDDRDPERARLARATLGKLERGTHTVSVPPVAIRILMKRKPPELLELLLRYLPYTTDPEVEEDIYYNIDELAQIDGKLHSALIRALQDKASARRAVAGCIVARVGTAEQKAAAEKLLKDADAYVRLRTAQGFLAGNQKTGIPTLIHLLDAKPVSLAWQAEELLNWAAGGWKTKDLVWAGGESATSAIATWGNWWKKAEAELDLTVVAKTQPTPRFYWAEKSEHVVGANGQLRWKFIRKESDPVFRIFAYLPSDCIIGVGAAGPLHDDIKMQYYNNCTVYQTSLVGRTIQRTTWQESLGLEPSRVFVAPNGMLTVVNIRHVISINVYERTCHRLNTADVLRDPTSKRIPFPAGVSDGLIWMIFGTSKATADLQILLVDPNDGRIVNRWLYADHHELWEQMRWWAFSRGEFVLRTRTAFWSFRQGKLRLHHKSDYDREDDFLTLTPLGRSGLAVISNGVITCRSFDWSVRSKVQSEAPLNSGPVSLPLGLVSFGFP